MSFPIVDMKAGYEIEETSRSLFKHNPRAIANIQVSNYPTLHKVFFHPNCGHDIDKNDTAVFHIKWKNTNQ